MSCAITCAPAWPGPACWLWPVPPARQSTRPASRPAPMPAAASQGRACVARPQASRTVPSATATQMTRPSTPGLAFAGMGW
ncbi:hypothetical protein IP87_13705 [beta proteobacterium AAP121]|nr:hypothetical protein IP87_13705 [beta proteobacterium AAP121]